MAEVGTAVGTAGVGKVTEKLVDQVLKLISILITRVFKWKSNVKNLKQKAEKLVAERQRVLQFTEAADRKGEEVALNFTNWLTSAEKYLEEMEKLGDDEDKAKKKCFAGLCPNPKARYKISKKVEEYWEAVAPLLEEAAGFKLPVSYCPPPQDISTVAVEGFEQFDSRMPTLNRVMEALRSASVDKIGIHGLPGVGKTMLAKEVARQAKEVQLFDVIVMASVKKNPDQKKIQGELADKLGVQLHGETEFGRANQLKAYLKRKKKILVILDDIWAKLDLGELGIPFEDKKNEASSTEEEQMQCKILLTSRDLNVLSYMGTHENIQVGTLQVEEAWTLLKKIVGDEVESSELLPTATEIMGKCAGLPLAVEAVAKAMKGKDAHVWRDALLQLKRPSQESFTGIPANVYSAIELSYNHLEGEELRQTFLLCCLLGHNSSIGDLLTYGIGLGLFRNAKTTGEARDRVLTLVSNLKSSSLLLDGCCNSSFDMHDIVHDVAISIALRGHHLLSIAEDHIPEEWSDREALEDFKWIGLQAANIGELPDELECPQLTLFYLYSKDPSMKIPENIFRGTHKLRVLDFTNLCFSSLPSSICLLKNLHTLHVNGCVLEDMAVIGKLTSLEVLSVSQSDIVEVPTEIGLLTQLKLLDLSNCTKLKMIRSHVLASLSKLEELYLGNSFDQWDFVEEDGNQRNASLAELKNLPNLAALDVHVCDVQFIPKDLFSERLERYKIFIGEVGNHWQSSFKSSKILKLELNSLNYDHSVGMLLKKTEELHLKELKGFKNVVYELDAEGFHKLKFLCIQNGAEVQHIINSVEWVLCHAFPILESLLLLNLSNLVTICHGQLGAMSFSRLRIITVECCNQLRNLFPFSIARQLLQLEEIRVTDCSNMVEIVDKEGQGTSNDIVEAKENFELVQLRSLKFEYLPKFVSLCYGNEESNDSSSNSTDPLFNKKIVFPNLEELQLCWIDIKSIWGRQCSITSSCIQSVKKLIIEGCDHLENLLSSSITRSLVQLRWLEIKKCKRMREIIETENAEEMGDLISFPKLDFLKIENLENLLRFCSGNYSVEFTSLRELVIVNCPELKGFAINHTSTDIIGGLEPLFNEKVAFLSLEILSISRLDSLRIIWHHQAHADSFCKLQSLSIEGCEKILTIFPSGILTRLCTSLEVLEVFACGSVEEIFAVEEVEESHAVVDTHLRRLAIAYLPRLKHVWTEDPRGILTFRNLQSVRARSCPNLQSMFPASVAMDLQQLEELRLSLCGIEEVVAFRGEKAVPRFVFPRVSSLYLWSLPRLRYFYPRKHVTEWPMLKKFYMHHCRGANRTNEESLGEYPVQLPIFSIEKVIPRLEKLTLTHNDIAMICDRQIRDIFSKVKTLRFHCYHDETAVFPISILERFLNLEKLCIGCSSFKELFSSSASIDFQKKQVGRHFRIRKLKLDLVHDIKYIWSQDSGQDPLLQNVESLKVLHCNGLISLSKSTASLRNLNNLLVDRCQGLKSLFSFATAQSLGQLQTMTVKECHLLTEIVGDEGDEFEDVIVFSKLKVLELKTLTILESFCSGKFTFKFPLLELVTVVQCPYFETFCHGVVNTPMLQRIQLTEEDDVGRPVVDLNNTINQSYKEKVGYSGLKHLKLSDDSPKLMEIWNRNPQEILDFKRIFYLEICKCGNLRYLLSPSMALNFVVLQRLKVQNCEMMEEVITEEGAMDVAEDKIILPLLDFIELESCPNLTSFFVGSYKLECPSLTIMNVLDCPKMGTFASAFSTAQTKEVANGGSEERIGKEDIDILTEPFFSGQVEFSSYLQLTLSSMNMQQIFHKQLSTMCSFVQSVGHLTLEGCGNLKYLFTPSMIKSFVELKYLHIRNCKMMNEVIISEGLADEERVLFSNLKSLELKGLPKLTRFCSGDFFKFPFLICLHICMCPMLETFISSSAVRDKSHISASNSVENTSPLFDAKVAFPSLEKIEIHGMGSWNKIWDSQLDASSFYKLEILDVGPCEKLLNIFPVTMLGRLQNLDELKIGDCASLEEIFEPQRLSASESQALETSQLTLGEPTPNFAFPKVTSLLLRELPNLKSIYPQMHTAEWPSLKGLTVLECNQVQILASELLSCQRKSRENQLENQNQRPLFWVSKATFPSLEELKLKRNDSMKEIWHGGDMNDITVFTKLKTLHLEVLPRLSSFCSGNCNFEFPSLEDVIVMGCPNMLTFSGGEVSTPKLQGVKLKGEEEGDEGEGEGENEGGDEDKEDGCWAGGLNPTIQQLFTKKSGNNSEENWSDALLKLFE